MSIHPVILCGGSGTRLWPLSRALYPKQFLPIVSDNSLLQETVERVSGDAYAAPLMICNDDHRFLVAEQLRSIDVNPGSIILEPSARSTAPAAAVAAILALKDDPDAIILLLPSDHVISKPDALSAAVVVAGKAAASGRLVTFGISPDGPETGYGYIQQGTPLEGVDGCFSIERFVEKPGREKAEQLLAAGGHYWNSGMFLFSAQHYLDELETLAPEMRARCQEAVDKGENDLNFFRLDGDAFAKCPADSIDYAVMEKTQDAAVVPVELGWNDVGSWSALLNIGERDEDGNVLKGDVMAVDTGGSYLRTDGPLLATVGLRDMVVVATGDAVLVAPSDRAADVKDIVARLKDEDREERLLHPRVHRPWGWYQGIDIGPNFQVKRICVSPGAKLSLQYHHHRAEHWVVVSGTARVTCGDKVFDLEENQSTYIPVGEKHRLENTTAEPVHLIEVQSGDYLGEDDIVRLDDDYARN